MLVKCSKCGRKYPFDETKFGERESLKVRCPNCKHVFFIYGPRQLKDETVSLVPEESREAIGKEIEDFDFEKVLKARMLIARAGEKDCLGWWDSRLLSSDGAFVFKRIFRRTHAWSRASLALEASRAREFALLEGKRALTLFNLGERFEALFTRYLEKFKKDLLPLEKLTDELAAPITTVNDLFERLSELREITSRSPSNAAPEITSSIKSVPVGMAKESQMGSLREMESVFFKLINGLQYSENGKLIVPYMAFER